MSHAPRDCATCGETHCAMHRTHGIGEPPVARASYVLDDAWPEYASLVAAQLRPDDQLLAPGLRGGWPARYRWGPQAQHPAALATALRHLAMRRVRAAPGAVRQAAYLRHDRALARSLARRIDYRAEHLVVAQRWLPWLGEVLGGRSFDVLMQRYPMLELHRLLDAAAAATGKSPSLTDFRADPALAEREAVLLGRARRVITPHHGIGALFAGRAVQLAWHLPGAAGPGGGERVAFLGPSIARERPDIVRRLAAGLEQPLVVFGAMLEPHWWDGLPIERRAMDAQWLRDIGTVCHPATVTHEPRRLLEAAASGVRICATAASGLDRRHYDDIESPAFTLN